MVTPYRAIIFDFFDVIHTDPLQSWLRAHGLPREGAVHAASVELDSGRVDAPGFIELLSKATGQPAEQILAEHKASQKLNEPLVALINSLRKHYKLALLSNGHGKVVRELLTKHSLEELFHHVAISSEIGHLKPSPDAFRHVLTQLGVPAGQAIFIDDNPKNTAGAEAVGIRGVVYTDLASLKASLKELGITLPAAT
jgi:putative hydrolase of the HAD superfamily